MKTQMMNDGRKTVLDALLAGGYILKVADPETAYYIVLGGNYAPVLPELVGALHMFKYIVLEAGSNDRYIMPSHVKARVVLEMKKLC